MVSGLEVPAKLIMALLAFRGSNVFRTRHIGQSNGLT
jgi:hypothetical protein